MTNSFYGLSSKSAIIIPESVDYVANSAFANNINISIYSHAETRPAGWDFKWNIANSSAYWGTLGPIYPEEQYEACENLDHTARLTKYSGYQQRLDITKTISDGLKEYNVTSLGEGFLTDSDFSSRIRNSINNNVVSLCCPSMTSQVFSFSLTDFTTIGCR